MSSPASRLKQFVPILAADGYRHWQGFLLLQPPLSSLLVVRQLPVVHVLSRPYWSFVNFLLSTSSLVLIGRSSASCCPRPLSSLLVVPQLSAVHVLSRPYWSFLSFLLSTSSLVLIGRSSDSCCPRPLSSLWVISEFSAVPTPSSRPYGSSPRPYGSSPRPYGSSPRPYGSFLSFVLSTPPLLVLTGRPLLLTGRFRYFCCSQPQSTKKKSSLALKRCHMNTATKTRTA